MMCQYRHMWLEFAVKAESRLHHDLEVCIARKGFWRSTCLAVLHEISPESCAIAATRQREQT